MTIQTKAIEQYFRVILFIVLWKVILILKFAGNTVKYDHSNESFRAVLSFKSVLLSVFSFSLFGVTNVCDVILKMYFLSPKISTNVNPLAIAFISVTTRTEATAAIVTSSSRLIQTTLKAVYVS